MCIGCFSCALYNANYKHGSHDFDRESSRSREKDREKVREKGKPLICSMLQSVPVQAGQTHPLLQYFVTLLTRKVECL